MSVDTDDGVSVGAGCDTMLDWMKLVRSRCISRRKRYQRGQQKEVQEIFTQCLLNSLYFCKGTRGEVAL